MLLDQKRENEHTLHTVPLYARFLLIALVGTIKLFHACQTALSLKRNFGSLKAKYEKRVVAQDFCTVLY